MNQRVIKSLIPGQQSWSTVQWFRGVLVPMLKEQGFKDKSSAKLFDLAVLDAPRWTVYDALEF